MEFLITYLHEPATWNMKHNHNAIKTVLSEFDEVFMLIPYDFVII